MPACQIFTVGTKCDIEGLLGIQCTKVGELTNNGKKHLSTHVGEPLLRSRSERTRVTIVHSQQVTIYMEATRTRSHPIPNTYLGT